ncbi:MAG: response regulator [Paenibacillaceae bacterium]|nr:response regulator [Paenibacillaceae bacterium]
MKIKTKLLLGLTTFPVLILLLAGVGWFQYANLDNSTWLLQQNFESARLIEQIQNGIKDEAIALRNILFERNDTSLWLEINKLQRARDTVTQSIDLLEPLMSTPELRIMTVKLFMSNRDYNNYTKKVISRLSDGDKQAVVNDINDGGDKFQDEMIQNITKMREIIGDVEENSLNRISKKLKHLLFIGIVISLAGVAIMIGTVADAFNRMIQSLDKEAGKEQEMNWITSNHAKITALMASTRDLESLAQAFLTKVVPLVEGIHAVFYLKASTLEEKPMYKLLSSYAFLERKHLSNTFAIGEGLIGQVALEKSAILLTDVPEDYIQVKSGLGKAAPSQVFVLPVKYNEEVLAIWEVATFKAFSEKHKKLLNQVTSSLGVVLDNLVGRMELAKLLRESQAMTAELQLQSGELKTRQEDLQSAYIELGKQTLALKQSEDKLQEQQRKLEIANSELKVKAELLALNSKYKTEFLANMSHELRTPLNSMLILSKLFYDNHDGSLSSKHLEYAGTIYTSGKELLALIDDILYLAKIETGKMEVHLAVVQLSELAEFIEEEFRSVSEQKGLEFRVVLASDLPAAIYSDRRKIQQILKNLLSNAFKFTKKGSVIMEIHPSSRLKGWAGVTFTVSDTGIGIPQDKQELIFQAFQQVDGSTSREYEGTGLGLSICRETAQLLQGEISVESKEGEGSKFSLFVSDYQTPDWERRDIGNREVAATNNIPGKSESDTGKLDHMDMLKGKKVFLVDTDVRNVFTVTNALELYGMEVIFAENGLEALELLKNQSRVDIVIVDTAAPGIDGYDMIRQIKQIPLFRELPIVVLSSKAMKEDREESLKAGANEYISKPVLPDQLVSLISLWI